MKYNGNYGIIYFPFVDKESKQASNETTVKYAWSFSIYVNTGLNSI